MSTKPMVETTIFYHCEGKVKMGTGLSKEQKQILNIVTELKKQKNWVSSVSRICEEMGIGKARVGYCTRKWIVTDDTRRKSIWRSLRRLEARGLIVNLGRGAGNEERWLPADLCSEK